MNYKKILSITTRKLSSLNSALIDVIDIKKPSSLNYAKQLTKVISKLSPLIGNMIEFFTIDMLNKLNWNGNGNWIRQDPNFPDALFKSTTILPNPGIEIKAWFPLATEITARFKDSITLFRENNINMALIAWIPEHIIWGKPQIIDVLVVSGKSVAKARDIHYHNPPYYIILEPEDTSDRTANLQQTNTNGYKLQEDKCNVSEAIKFVDTWGKTGKIYSPKFEYQQKLKKLHGEFVYRIDTNYAKIDRIQHSKIELFKNRVLNTKFYEKTIKQWNNIFNTKDDNLLESTLKTII